MSRSCATRPIGPRWPTDAPAAAVASVCQPAHPADPAAQPRWQWQSVRLQQSADPAACPLLPVLSLLRTLP